MAFFQKRSDLKNRRIEHLCAFSLGYNSISSASFSEKSDILDSLSELTLFSWPLNASSVAYFLTYSANRIYYYISCIYIYDSTCKKFY